MVLIGLVAATCAALLVLLYERMTQHIYLTVPQPPAPASVTIGVVTQRPDSAVLSATVKDANGNRLLGQAITWTTSDPSIAPVFNAGDTGTVTVTGINGTVTITATCQGVSDTIIVTVSGGTGGTLTITPIPWPFLAVFA